MQIAVHTETEKKKQQSFYTEVILARQSAEPPQEHSDLERDVIVFLSSAPEVG